MNQWFWTTGEMILTKAKLENSEKYLSQFHFVHHKFQISTGRFRRIASWVTTRPRKCWVAKETTEIKGAVYWKILCRRPGTGQSALFVKLQWASLDVQLALRNKSVLDLVTTDKHLLNLPTWINLLTTVLHTLCVFTPIFVWFCAKQCSHIFLKKLTNWRQTLFWIILQDSFCTAQ